ncbi:MAG TPA: hypothetical protein VKE40_07970, partial [Gemmataceae bacterium]|nr:hypothetical protein [Gemmataceae bacterium]
VLEQVARPEFRVGPGGVQILSPDTVSRPEGIEGRLARFLRPGRHAPPFWVAVILALLLGGLVGVPAAYFVQLQKAPIVVTKYIPTSWGYTETYQYADTSGEPLSADQYSIRRRHVEAVSIVVGVVVGLIVAAAGTWRLTRRRKYLWPTLAAILVGLFVLGLPAAFGTFTFVDWFLGPTRAYPPSRTPEYRSYRGEKLEPFQFAHETRQVAMAGVMVGATVALVLTVALVGIVRWRCHVWERTAQGEEGPEAPTAAPPSPVVTPELLRTDRMGMTVLRSRLLEYARARKSAAMTNIFLAVVTFAIVLPMALMCMGLIGKDVSNTWLAILFVLPVGALIVGSAVMWWVWVRRRHRDRQREMADELIRTFGPVFDQWGGPGFLNNPKTVDEVLAELYRRDQPLG